MLRAMMIHMAWPPFEKNGWGPKPSIWTSEFIRPCCANSIDQISETTTQDVTTGRKNAVRNTVRNGSRSFMARAMSNGRVVSPRTAKNAKKKVLRSAVWNSGSVNSWTKLPAPTKVGARFSVASNKLRYSEYRSGYARTTTNRIRYGDSRT